MGWDYDDYGCDCGYTYVCPIHKTEAVTRELNAALEQLRNQNNREYKQLTPRQYRTADYPFCEDGNGSILYGDEDSFEDDSEYYPPVPVPRTPAQAEIYDGKGNLPADIKINNARKDKAELEFQIKGIEKKLQVLHIQLKIEYLNEVKKANKYVCIDGTNYAKILYAGPTKRGFGVKYQLYNRLGTHWTDVAKIRIEDIKE